MLNTKLNAITLAPIIADETDEQARIFVESLLWPNGPTCPHCACVGAHYLMHVKGKQTPKQKLEDQPAPSRTLYKCKDCRKPFTVRMGTIFEDSHIPLRKWLMAVHLMTSSKKGVSSLQISREVGIMYKSAWFMTHRIREAMNMEREYPSLEGTIEVDETYVGGKPRKGSGNTRTGRGTKKIPVIVLVERDGSAVSHPISRVTTQELKGAIRKNVKVSAKICTDEYRSYKGIGKEFARGHSTVHHSSGEYKNADGEHTNTAESFFALIKRGHYGIFHLMSEQHLHRYVTEFEFRWNLRKVTDGERMVSAIKGARGKRLYSLQPTEGAQP